MSQLTTKELEYIIDSMSNEDLIVKQATAVLNESTHAELTQVCQHIIQEHHNNFNSLLGVVEQHYAASPQSLN